MNTVNETLKGENVELKDAMLPAPPQLMQACFKHPDLELSTTDNIYTHAHTPRYTLQT